MHGNTNFIFSPNQIFRTGLTGFLTGILVLLSVYPAHAQDFQLSGAVSCAECTSGIQGVSVLVYPIDSESETLLAFDFTDSEGEFDIHFANPESNKEVRVIFRSLRFAEADTTLYLPEDSSERIYIEMMLREEVQELEEVVIQAQRPLFELRGDTLVFFLEDQRDQYDRNLNDLLDRLPGLEVNFETGNISYLGNSVSYMLLDGDDLMGNQYGDLGRILNPVEVEGVQLLTNYQANRLLKGVQPGEIALNIQLKDSLLIKPKITVSGGALSNQRVLGQVQPEVLALQQNHKWVLSAGVLNTGEDFSAFGTTSIEEMVQGGRGPDGRSFLGTMHREADLPRSAFVQNRQTYTTLNHLYSKGEQFRWRSSVQADLQNGSMRREIREEFFNRELEISERVGDTDFRFDHVKLQAKTSVEVDIGSDTHSKSEMEWRLFDENTNRTFTNPSVSNGSEWAVRKQQRLELSQELTHRPAQGELYTARFNFIHLTADHRKELFQNLPQFPEFEKNGHQDLLEKYQQGTLSLETTRKSFADIRVSTFINAETRKEEIDLLKLTSPFILSDLPENDIESQIVNFRDVAVGQRYNKQHGRFDWFVMPSLKLAQVRIENGNSSLELLGEADTRIQFSPGSATSYSIGLSRQHETPVSQIFLAFPILISNQSVIQGSMQPDLMPVNKLNISMRYFGPEANDPFVLITGTLTHRERSLIVEQQIEPEFTFYQYRTEEKSGLTGFIMARLSQNFNSLNSGYSSNTNLFYHEFLIAQQGEGLQWVRSWNLDPSLNIFYNPRRWLALESGVSWGRMVSQSAGYDTQHQQNGRLMAKVDVRMREFQLIMHYRQIRPDLRHTTDVRLLNTELRYRSNTSSLEIRLLFNNILNQKFYDRTRLSDLSTLTSRLEMVPSSGILEISWNF